MAHHLWGAGLVALQEFLARALDEGSVTYETTLEEVSQDHMSNFGSQTLNHLAKHHSEDFSNKGPHAWVTRSAVKEVGVPSGLQKNAIYVTYVKMSQPTTFEPHTAGQWVASKACTGYHEGEVGSLPLPLPNYQWKPHSWELVQPTSWANSQVRILPQVLLSPCTEHSSGVVL